MLNKLKQGLNFTKDAFVSIYKGKAFYVLVFLFTLLGVNIYDSYTSKILAASCPPCCPPCICGPCPCSARTYTYLSGVVSNEHNNTRFNVFGYSGGPVWTRWPIPSAGYTASPTGRMGQHELWLQEIFFAENLLPALMMMTEQFSAIMMQQTFVIGTFMDASIQLETQRHLQQLVTEAHRDYHTDVGMCIFGTNIRSLANVDRRSEAMLEIMSSRSIHRQLGTRDSVGADGRYQDIQSRLFHFRETYCDVDDNNKIRGTAIDYLGAAVGADPNTGLTLLNSNGAPDCDVSANTLDANLKANRDIDYTTLIEMPLTLELDFPDTPGTPTDDEEDVLSMASYLYSHDVSDRFSPYLLDIESNQEDYLRYRSVVAKRSVAEASFYAIASMKARGNPGTTDDTFRYMQTLLYELGHPPNTMQDIYGEYPGGELPSYLAQMEILAKNMYMRPEFYINLHGKVANLDRRSVAMQAIDLMLQRDTFKSFIRTEMIISQLLEMEVIDFNDDMTNKILNADTDVKPN